MQVTYWPSSSIFMYDVLKIVSSMECILNIQTRYKISEQRWLFKWCFRLLSISNNQHFSNVILLYCLLSEIFLCHRKLCICQFNFKWNFVN